MFCHALAATLRYAFGNEELGIFRPAVGGFGESNFFGAERRTVDFRRILHVRATEANVISDADERRFFVLRFRQRNSRIDSFQIGAIFDAQNVPLMRFKASTNVFCKADIGRAVDRNVVVIVEHDELAQSQMPSNRRRFGANAFHEATIATNRIRIVIDDVVTGAVITRREVRFGNRKSNGIGNALPEWARRRIDSRRDVVFRVTRRNASHLAELFQIVETDRISIQMEQSIQKRRSMTIR